MESSTMVLDNGAELTTYSAPDLREIVIPARGRYDFDIPLSRHRESSFTPGPRIVTVKDEKEQLRSNPLKFHVVLTRRGVDRLLQRVKDKSLDQPERNWPSDWLEYVHPEPRLWANYKTFSGEMRSKDEREKIEETRQARIREWEEFWEKARDTPEMRKQLEELNGFHGVPVDVVRAMEERDDKAAAEESEKQSSQSKRPLDSSSDSFSIPVSDSADPSSHSVLPTGGTVVPASNGRPDADRNACPGLDPGPPGHERHISDVVRRLRRGPQTDLSRFAVKRGPGELPLVREKSARSAFIRILFLSTCRPLPSR